MLARALRRAPRAARAPAAGSRACTPRLRPRPLPLAAGWSLVPRRLYCGSGRLAKNTWEEAGSEIDIAKTSRLFPQPRVTLNILVDKLQEKPFEVYYKQSAIAPKISKKNKPAEKNDWTCSYVFQWPEQKKFESTALSKKQAAEKAASAAVHWLHTIGRLDDRGSPVHDRQRLQQLRENLNPPVVISTSVESQQSIQRVVEHYDGGIKEIFAKAHRAVLQKEHNNFLAVTNDSTIEDEDELTDDDLSSKVQQDLESSTELQRRVHPVYGRPIVAPTDTSLARRDDNLRRKFISYYEGLTPLPIDGYVDSFIQTLSSSRTVVLVGAAGCGKSTRAPVAVLREGGASATVLVSQPRRVAAVGLASRVASELGEQVGETVGYQVRLHAKLPRPPGGSILYCTSGVLLRRLQTNPGLEGCSHVFIDEAHERDINTDIILLLLRRALWLNSQLKVVVMSATLDTAVFTSYFDDCPILEVPGRTYPVESTYLEDIQQRLGNLRLQNFREASEKADVRPQINCKEVAEVIKAVDVKEPEGAMLVFLPGWAEIKAVRGFLAEFFDNSGRHFVLPVHSKLSTTEQVKMFSRPPPGVRKIILATNIAETSVTIPDVTCVVDSGVHKENRMKQGTGTSSLETVWISQAAAKQRMGRAGRVQPGRCYKLYTREKEEAFLTHTSPEVLRVPLEKTVLDCKGYAPNDKAEQFLAQLPEPPSSEAIQRAVDDLVDLGALSLPEQRLTALGRLISTFTLHPRLCVALLHSVVLCNVASTLNVVTQLAANVEVFADAVERREEIRSIKAKFHPTSDHLALHWIQEEYSSSEDAEKFCDQHGLRKERLKFVRDLSNLHLEQLHQCGILEPGPDYSQLNTYSDVDELTKAVLFSGADCSLMTKQCLKTKGRVHRQTGIFASTGERAHISSESVNYKIHKAGSGAALLAYFGGMHSVERRALVVHRTSLLSWLTAVLFSKGDYSVAAGTAEDGSERRLIHFPRHKLTVHTSPRQAELLLDLRRILWETFRYFTERDRTSEVDMEVYDEVIDFRNKLVKTVAKLLMEAENELIMSNREKMENRRG